jgi:glucans biosynthesis protein
LPAFPSLSSPSVALAGDPPAPKDTKAPAKDAPAKDAPAKDAPAKDAPAKDAPAKDAGSKDGARKAKNKQGSSAPTPAPK